MYVFEYTYLAQILLLSWGQKKTLCTAKLLGKGENKTNMESKYHTAWNSEVKTLSFAIMWSFLIHFLLHANGYGKLVLNGGFFFKKSYFIESV